jgi:hypothetical protein
MFIGAESLVLDDNNQESIIVFTCGLQLNIVVAFIPIRFDRVHAVSRKRNRYQLLTAKCNIECIDIDGL